ncbi:MAG: electron transfer flavoprotein subunit beta/FixA family protein [Euryarchaeota archaeon]|nr:electron transfer flavoprotein subunit beta/FixA family protein [Euryarchaeota archaeon]
MNIIVLLKQVPDTTAKISISSGCMDESTITKWSMSPYDEFALESALQLRQNCNGNLIAITCGPDRCSKMLTDAAAVGTDKLIHIHHEGYLDSIQTQTLLVAAIKKFEGEVIMCGKQAADTNSGSTGPGVAELIGASCITHVSEVKYENEELIATRLNSLGFEIISTSPPSIFAFDKGVKELRRPNVRGIMMAKKKEITRLTPEDLGVSLTNSNINLISQMPPSEKAPGKKYEGTDSIREIVSKLRDEANVI